jgi:hypothetical protein
MFLFEHWSPKECRWEAGGKSESHICLAFGHQDQRWRLASLDWVRMRLASTA